MLNTQELQEIKARVEGATPEPWKSLGSLVLDGSEIVASCHIRSDDMTPSRVGDMSRANARLIAACRTDLPRLIEAYESAIEKLDGCQEKRMEIALEDIQRMRIEERQAIIEMLKGMKIPDHISGDVVLDVYNHALSDAITLIKQRDL